MEQVKVGFAFCGSFCTLSMAMTALERVKARFGDVTPIVSEAAAANDTRFGPAHEFMREMERICDKRVIDSLVKAEPIGPKKLLDILIIEPCTGNTIGKLATGITDTPVTLAAKAHLRNNRPVLIGVSTNDALGAAAKNIGQLLNYKNLYMIPMRQDDCVKKPNSIVADFTKTYDAAMAALNGEQLQPVLV